MASANTVVRYAEIFRQPGATTPSVPSTGKTITVKVLPLGLTNSNFAQYKVWVGPAATAVAYQLTAANTAAKTVSIATAVSVTTATQLWIGDPISVFAGMQVFYTRAAITVIPGTTAKFGIGREFFSLANYTINNSNSLLITPAVSTGSPSIGQTTLYIGGIAGAASDSISLAQHALGGPQKPRDWLAIQENNPFLNPYAGSVGSNGLPTFPLLSTLYDKASIQIAGYLATGSISAPTEGYFDVDMSVPTTDPSTGAVTRQFRRYYFNSFSVIDSFYHNLAIVAAYNLVSVTTGSTTVITNLGSAIVEYYRNVPFVYQATMYNSAGTFYANVAVDNPDIDGTLPYLNFYTRSASQSPTTTILAARTKIQNRSIAKTLSFSESLTVTTHLVTHVYNVNTLDQVVVIDSIGASASKYNALVNDALAFSEEISARGKTLLGNTTDIISFSDNSVLPMRSFNTPKTKVVPPILPDSRGASYMLFRHYEIRERHVNVFRLKDGTFVQDYPTPENSNANVPYPYNPNDPSGLYAYVHNWNGTIEEYHLPNPIVQIFLGGETTMVSQELANELVHAGYAAYLEPVNA